MRGRGHGRLSGPGPSSGPGLGSGRGPGRGRGRGNRTTGGNAGSRVVDDFEPVPFYTNMFGKISKEQYDRNKTNPKLHPDDCGLGEFYEGSLPWHVRNQGRIFIPRSERNIDAPPRSRKRPKKEPKILKLPENEGPEARDFDEICDALQLSSETLSELLWNEYLDHKDDPVDPDETGANFFFPGFRPQFPPFPDKGNPFELLPTTSSGIFPFDRYGSAIFDPVKLARWKNDPEALPELLEVQIRQLIKLYQLDKMPKIYAEPADEGSYGVQTPVYVGKRDSSGSSGRDEKSGSSKVTEPDSGFYSIEPEVDPWSGNGDLLPPSPFSWEPVDGSGFVSLANSPISNFAHTQV